MRYSFSRRLFLAILALLAVYGLLETAAQILRRQAPEWFNQQQKAIIVPEPPLVSDEQLMWRSAPGVHAGERVSYLINAQGRRGPESDPVKKTGVYRLMTLGGGAVYGVGVAEQETFPFLAGARLGERLRRRVEVINGAVPGYSSTQARLVFEQQVDQCQPDAVILAGSEDDLTPVRWSDQELLHELTPADLPVESAGAWWRKSALAHGVRVRRQTRQGDWRDNLLPWSRVTAVEPGEVKVRVSRLRQADNLRAVLRESKARHIRVCLLLVERPAGNGNPDPERARRRETMRRLAEDFDVPLIDPSPWLRERSAEEWGELFPDGIYPGAPVHGWIAEQVVQCLTDSVAAPSASQAAATAVIAD